VFTAASVRPTAPVGWIGPLCTLVPAGPSGSPEADAVAHSAARPPLPRFGNYGAQRGALTCVASRWLDEASCRRGRLSRRFF